MYLWAEAHYIQLKEKYFKTVNHGRKVDFKYSLLQIDCTLGIRKKCVFFTQNIHFVLIEVRSKLRRFRWHRLECTAIKSGEMSLFRQSQRQPLERK